MDSVERLLPSSEGSVIAGDSRLDRRTLSAQIEEVIRAGILTGKLRPGDRIRASDIALRYGVSATPLREALGRLAGEGLVDIAAQAGARVHPASREELHDIYALRLQLEPEALRQSITHGNAEWDVRLEAAGRRLREATQLGDYGESVAEWSMAHDEFQNALFAACPSGWLMRFVGTMYAHAQRYRCLALIERTANAIVPRDDLIREHDAIYEAALGRDIRTALDALEYHLQATVATVDREFQSFEGGGTT